MDYFREGRVVPAFAARLEVVRELLQSGGRSIAQGALGWLWAKSKTTLPIPGFRSARHADDTIGAACPWSVAAGGDGRDRGRHRPRAGRTATGTLTGAF